MFRKTELGDHEAVIKGIRFVCEEPDEDTEERAKRIAAVYPERLADIAAFLIEEGIGDIFEGVTEESLAKSLGKPIIDLDGELLTYPDHSLDDDHIIDLEFQGDLETFVYMDVDG